MAAIPYDAPRPYSNSQQKTFPRRYGAAGTGQTFDTANFVVLSAGVVAICSNNAVSVSGLSDHPAQAIFANNTVSLTSLFGSSVSTQVQPFAPGIVDHYCPVFDNQMFEISLKETYLATMAGVQQVGITIDPTTSFWIASTALSACAQIYRDLPTAQYPVVAGNTGGRVIITFLAASVV